MYKTILNKNVQDQVQVLEEVTIIRLLETKIEIMKSLSNLIKFK